jgi:capsular polysaccharide biosynthesis protein
MDNSTNLLGVIQIVLKWRKHIIIATVAAAIIAALVSLFVLDEYFKSSTQFYPVNQGLSDRSAMFNTTGTSTVNYYGDKNDVNRVLSIANSTNIIDEVISKYNLVAHYKIDKNKKFWKTLVRKEFKDNYSAIKTERDAIEVTLYDTDPELAATIVNDIVGKVDSLNSIVVKEFRERMLNSFTTDSATQIQKLHLISDSLTSIAQRYNISVRISDYGENVIEGGDFHSREIVKALVKEQENSSREYLNRNNIKDQLQISLKNKASSLHVLEPAMPADKKSKPVRWLVVVSVAFGVFIFSILGALAIEQLKTVQEQLRKKD